VFVRTDRGDENRKEPKKTGKQENRKRAIVQTARMGQHHTAAVLLLLSNSAFAVFTQLQKIGEKTCICENAFLREKRVFHLGQIAW
jgi:hypothetical protein